MPRVAHEDRERASGLSVETEVVDGALVVRLAGELDLAGAPGVVSAAQWAAEQPGRAPLVLDVGKVSFIDSTGIRTLLEVSRATDRPVALLSPSSTLTRVLEMTQLRGRFVEIADLDERTLSDLARATT
jgi:anti-sigma B factor antagonist